MARGAGRFNGPALRQARQAAGLSAERLAKRVGTTKAMVLAYETGKTTPEAGRAAELADALDISRAALLPASTVQEEPDTDRESQTQYEISNSPALRLAEQFSMTKGQMEALLSVDGRVVPRMHDRSLRDLRQIAGISGVETATQAGISVTTYRAIENEGRLPSRGNGRFPALLARSLHVPVKHVEDSLILHPTLVQRRIEVAEIFSSLLPQVDEDPDFSVSSESEPVQAIAEILAQPPAILSRAVNYEIHDYRRALRRQSDALSRVKYPLTQDRNRGAVANQLSRSRRRLRHAPEQAAARLWWSLSQALTIRQWRTYAALIDFQSRMIQRISFPDSTVESDVGNALSLARFRGHPILEVHTDPSQRVKVYRFTPISVSFYSQEREFYTHLYPRVYAPGLSYAERERFPARGTTVTIRSAQSL